MLHPRHRGAKRLAAAVEAFREDEVTRSDLEAMFLALCDAHGLPRPLVNHVVHDEEVHDPSSVAATLSALLGAQPGRSMSSMR